MDQQQFLDEVEQDFIKNSLILHELREEALTARTLRLTQERELSAQRPRSTSGQGEYTVVEVHRREHPAKADDVEMEVDLPQQVVSTTAKAFEFQDGAPKVHMPLVVRARAFAPCLSYWVNGSCVWSSGGARSECGCGCSHEWSDDLLKVPEFVAAQEKSLLPLHTMRILEQKRRDERDA